ncbi:MAG: lectin [Pseudoxanthomonas sp.]
MRTLSLATALVVALAGCQQQAATDAPMAATDPSPATSPATGAVVSTAPADAGALPVVEAASQASFAGYGDMKLGSTVEEARLAWAGDLNGKPTEGSTCYYLSPKWVKAPSDFAFMIEDGKFVRYDVGTDKEAAPGGGKVGMTTDALQKLYRNSLQSSPHKYVEGGSYLSLDDAEGSSSKLVFETDAAGKVTAWRVGLAPQADYVEGCS